MKQNYRKPRTEEVQLIGGTQMFNEFTSSGGDNNPLNPTNAPHNMRNL